MVSPSYLTKLDADYIRSGSWICKLSPTGAHHWIEAVEMGLFVCRYCMGSRKFPTTYDINRYGIKEET